MSDLRQKRIVMNWVVFQEDQFKKYIPCFFSKTKFRTGQDRILDKLNSFLKLCLERRIVGNHFFIKEKYNQVKSTEEISQYTIILPLFDYTIHLIKEQIFKISHGRP